MSEPRKTRVLVLSDSPAIRPATAPTGFAKVAKNILTHWTEQGIEIDVWGLHFDGWGYRNVPWTIIPGGGTNWNSPKQLSAFLNLLTTGIYTHVWMLMDPDALCIGNFPAQLRAVCKKHSIHSTLYFPVDANLEFNWMDIIREVDSPVTFTEFGREKVRATLHQSLFPIEVIPHGLEGHFKGVSQEERLKERAQIVIDGKQFASESDFLMLNVNKNEWRKDPLRSLEILKGLINRKVPAKLVLRMDGISYMNGINVLRAATQLGLKEYEHYVCLDAVPEPNLPNLYQAADLYLTTTLGEGWGLGITEALACGTPVAVPMHTSCFEITRRITKELLDGTEFEKMIDDDSRLPVTWLNLENDFVFGNDTRLRRRVDCCKAVTAIQQHYESKPLPFELTEGIREWLSWERIANEFLKLMNINQSTQ
jgi:glycosyltransferase involved in cell wall biosynthesis